MDLRFLVTDILYSSIFETCSLLEKLQTFWCRMIIETCSHQPKERKIKKVIATQRQ